MATTAPPMTSRSHALEIRYGTTRSTNPQSRGTTARCFLPYMKSPQPDRAKEKTQKQRRSSYLGHARRYPAGQGRDAFIASAATVCWVSICDTAALQPTGVENTRECSGLV